jgi:hypothetical protein
MGEFLDEMMTMPEKNAKLYLAEIVLGVQQLHEVGTLSHCSRLQ